MGFPVRGWSRATYPVEAPRRRTCRAEGFLGHPLLRTQMFGKENGKLYTIPNHDIVIYYLT